MRDIAQEHPVQPPELQETMLLDTSSLLMPEMEFEAKEKPEPDASQEPASSQEAMDIDLDSDFQLEMETPSLQRTADPDRTTDTPVPSQDKPEMGISLDDLDLFPEPQIESKPDEDRFLSQTDAHQPVVSEPSFMEEIFVEAEGQQPEVALDQESASPSVSPAIAETKSDSLSFDDIEALDLDEIERLIEKSQIGGEGPGSESKASAPTDEPEEISFDRLDLDDGEAPKGHASIGSQQAASRSFTETAVLDTGALGMDHQRDNELAEGQGPAAAPKVRKPISKPLIGLLCLVLLSGIGYVGMRFFPDIQIPFLSPSTPAPEDIAGNLKIRVFDVNSKFTDSSALGRLFVITGKIRNDYPDPRGFVQIKGKLYDTAKKVVQTQTGYCGNVISDSDLATMNEESIKKALSNRLGTDRSNAKIPPGGTVPFMIVFSRLPEQLDEFSLEVVSSAKISP
ncbi:DUF3426 domain-containing protein [Desulfatirhabdium butyrativorans]|uniref:DUF3426 domain-containing protein n=1 Tax=Desulfatirhabdium butyrativorans TaxID=340467 RepID=UPI001FE0FCA3|nr:DUF3426 domain-containing protein [Desulfatirhabdium butyrativorans]